MVNDLYIHGPLVVIRGVLRVAFRDVLPLCVADVMIVLIALVGPRVRVVGGHDVVREVHVLVLGKHVDGVVVLADVFPVLHILRIALIIIMVMPVTRPDRRGTAVLIHTPLIHHEVSIWHRVRILADLHRRGARRRRDLLRVLARQRVRHFILHLTEGQWGRGARAGFLSVFRLQDVVARTRVLRVDALFELGLRVGHVHVIVEVVAGPDVTTSVTAEDVLRGVCLTVVRDLAAGRVTADDDSVSPLVPVRLAWVHWLVEHWGVLQADVEVLVPSDVRIRIPVDVIVIILVEPIWECEVLLIPARP